MGFYLTACLEETVFQMMHFVIVYLLFVVHLNWYNHVYMWSKLKLFSYFPIVNNFISLLVLTVFI